MVYFEVIAQEWVVVSGKNGSMNVAKVIHCMTIPDTCHVCNRSVRVVRLNV